MGETETRDRQERTRYKQQIYRNGNEYFAEQLFTEKQLALLSQKKSCFAILAVASSRVYLCVCVCWLLALDSAQNNRNYSPLKYSTRKKIFGRFVAGFSVSTHISAVQINSNLFYSFWSQRQSHQLIAKQALNFLYCVCVEK